MGESLAGEPENGWRVGLQKGEHELSPKSNQEMGQYILEGERVMGDETGKESRDF